MTCGNKNGPIFCASNFKYQTNLEFPNRVGKGTPEKWIVFLFISALKDKMLTRLCEKSQIAHPQKMKFGSQAFTHRLGTLAGTIISWVLGKQWRSNEVYSKGLEFTRSEWVQPTKGQTTGKSRDTPFFKGDLLTITQTEKKCLILLSTN